MFNVIIFLLGAGIMFFMALRSVLARRRLCTQGQKVTATVEGTVQSRDGGAYVLAFTTAGGSHCTGAGRIGRAAGRGRSAD